MANEQEIDNGLKTMRIMWFSLFIPLAVYAGLTPLIAEKIHIILPQQSFATLRAALYVVSLFTLIGSRAVRKLILSAKKPVRKSVANAHAHTVEAIRKYTTAMIVSLALAEAIGIYGLVLYLLGKNQTDLYLLILLSAAAMVLHFPKRNEILAVIQAR